MATSRQQAAAERRRHIRDVALRLFARYGFAATTTKLIAKEAGVAEGLLFHYFGNKVELLRAIADSPELDRAAVTGALRACGPASPGEGVRAFGTALLAHLREHSDLMAVLAAEGQIDGELAGLFWELVGEFRTELALWLADAVDHGSVAHDAPVEAAASAVTSSLSFFFLEHRGDDERWDRLAEQHVSGLAALIVDGITPRGGRGE
ncbi:TetR/AcrR family transcriptional regulator [Nocardiopsis sp. EMB25]|uniref:TetR/AcrR family transcriptional regulator n=1 Tax=Nocardiopsis TaxID=2013 RepID=UPI0003495DA3|nr:MULTISPECIES: TetR/AcrR family transcriptional regulator [Nocardiopsis]MCY9783602.1 TetR/AcrR family transcriptional regulator [Nocardiopsis sp. EMB25]